MTVLIKEPNEGLNVSDNYRLLLERAGRLFDRHEAARVEPFNVFSVLRSPADEVNLHSRFLTALLDHRQLPERKRENLNDFLNVFGIDGIDHENATVEREKNYIDILIRDHTVKRAVIVENKILAADQDRQLQWYKEQVESAGYEELRILYLTPDGRDASDESAGDLEYLRVSYRDDLRPWLKRCQQRAYDEPALRESVAQYLRLIEKLTGTDASEAYMTRLEELCLEKDSNGASNLLLVYDLENAAVEAKINLLVKLWKEIRGGLAGISDLPDPSEEHSDVDKSTIKDFMVRLRGGGCGLCYEFGDDARLEVWQERRGIYLGVYCDRSSNSNDYEKLESRFRGGHKNDVYPWYEYFRPDFNPRYPTRENLHTLIDDTGRREYVDELVSSVSDAWHTIRNARLSVVS